MANVICHDGYCEPALTREENTNMTLGEVATIGGIGLVLIAILALSLYGTSLGYYPVPLS